MRPPWFDGRPIPQPTNEDGERLFWSEGVHQWVTERAIRAERQAVQAVHDQAQERERRAVVVH